MIMNIELMNDTKLRLIHDCYLIPRNIGIRIILVFSKTYALFRTLTHYKF